MKQKNQGWIGLRNFIILVLFMVIIVSIHRATVWITRNELLFPTVALIGFAVMWAVWDSKRRSKAAR